MRDFRLQATIDIARAILRREIRLIEFLAYWSHWLKPQTQVKVRANRLFNVSDLGKLRGVINRMARFDPLWYPRLFEPSSRGVRAWEYGILAQNLDLHGKKILDVGVGNSRLPNYLAHSGATVTAIDIEQPLEETHNIYHPEVHFELQDMTQMTLPDKSYDIVVSISTLEHVEMEGGQVVYKGQKYLDRALQSIREMARVLKPGGYLYLTTDFYLDRQIGDLWDPGAKDIHGAFDFDTIPAFQDLFHELHLKFVHPPKLSPDILVRDQKRANFRGRYITTIAFLLRKSTTRLK
jgi:2-polyprenyl-3-methyl-5-hydroxy-6-metoxy-1,4-benzoquinol methylase